MKRDFNEWLDTFRSSICDYKFYVDFEKVYGKVDNIKVELNILNSLIGSKNIENDFKNLVTEYPKVLKCIPILLAVRSREIYAIDSDGEYWFNFAKQNYSIDEYIMFMRKTGLFSLISEHLINNLVDYVTGVEVGLDSNGRKNRGGHLMEDLVESYLVQAGLQRNVDYFKEMYLSDVEKQWIWTCRAFQTKAKRKNVLILWLRKIKPFMPLKRISIRAKVQNSTKPQEVIKLLHWKQKKLMALHSFGLPTVKVGSLPAIILKKRLTF